MITDLQGQISEWEQWYYQGWEDTVADPASQVDTLLQVLGCCTSAGETEAGLVIELETISSVCDDTGDDRNTSAGMSDSGFTSTASADEFSRSGTTSDAAACRDVGKPMLWTQRAKRKQHAQRQPPIGSAPIRDASQRRCNSNETRITLQPVDERPAWASAGQHGPAEASMDQRRPAWASRGQHGPAEASMGQRRPA